MRTGLCAAWVMLVLLMSPGGAGAEDAPAAPQAPPPGAEQPATPPADKPAMPAEQPAPQPGEQAAPSAGKPAASPADTPATPAEKPAANTLGVELAGDMLRREVAQVAINFHNHRLVDPAIGEAEARRLLKRRAFDHLLSLALSRITEAKGERAGLSRQRDLLRRKLNALKQGGWNFDDADSPRPEPGALQAELEEIEKQLAESGADSDTLNRHLDIVAELLGNAEHQFWSESIDLHLDRMNIQRPAEDASAQHIRLQELHNTRGQQAVLLLVSLKYEELPQQQKFSEMAERYLR